MITVLPAAARRRRLAGRGLLLGSVGALVVGTASGVAYAAWSVSATGSSQASAGTPTAGVVSVATPTAGLYPGGSTAVYFTVTNPNSFPVTYNALTFGTVTVSGDSAHLQPGDVHHHARCRRSPSLWRPTRPRRSRRRPARSR